jgi:hypothetical protein
MPKNRRVCALAALLLIGFAAQAAAQQPAPPTLAQAPRAQSQPKHKSFRTHFTFHNTDVAKLLRRLRRFGLRLPVTVVGKVTTRVDVSVPISELFRSRDYQISATIDSPRLTIAGQDLWSIHAELAYAGGLLSLTDFNFDLASPDTAPAGKVTGGGQMQLNPPGDLRLTMRAQGVLADRLAASPLAASLPWLKGVRGRIDGDVSAAAGVDDLKVPAAWRIDGQAAIGQLAIAGVPPLDGQTRVHVEKGLLNISQLRVRSGDTSLAGSVQVQVAAPYAFQAVLDGSIPRLQAWQAWIAKFVALPGPIAGRVNFSTQVAGTLTPSQLRTATGKFDAAGLSLDGFEIDRLQGDLASDGRNAVVRNLRISVFGGTVTGSLSAPLSSTGQMAMEFAWTGVQLAPAARAAGLSRPVAGAASGRVNAQVPLERLRELTAWAATGSATASGIRVYGSSINQTAATFQLAHGRVGVPSLTGDFDGGRLSGSLSLDLAAPYRTTANMELVGGDLSRFNALPGALRPPVELAGRYSVRAGAQGTLEPLAGHAAGGFIAVDARAGRARADRLSFVFSGTQDALRVDNLQASLWGGQASGKASLSFTPQGPPGEAAIQWQGINLASLAQLTPQVPANVRGTTSGRIQLGVPAGRLMQWAEWTADGRAQAAGLGVGAFELGQASAEFAVREKKLQATRLELTGPMGTFQANAQLSMLAPLDYSAHLQVTQANLAVLAALPQLSALGTSTAGKLGALIDVHGTLQPLVVSGQANLSASGVVIHRMKIDRATLEARFDRRRLELLAAEMELYDGRATASGAINLDGPSKLQAQMQGIDLATLAASQGYAPGHLAAVANGNLTLEIGAGKLADPTDWQLHAALELPKIAAGKADLGTLDAAADYQPGTLSYHAKGQLLGGTLVAQGKVHLSPGKKPLLPGEGQVQLDGVQLDKLATLLNRPVLAPLSGTLSLAANVHPPQQDTGTAPIGSGSFALNDLHWHDQVLIDRFAGQLRATQRRIELVDTEGGFAGGSVRLNAVMDLARPLASVFSLEIMDAQLAPLGALVGEQRPLLRGGFDLALRGSLARPWALYGTAVVGEGQVAGVRISDARFSLDAEVDPLTGTGQFQVSQASMTVGDGRATGQVTADFRGQLRIQASASFSNLNLRTISGQLSSVGRMTSGKISGTLTASGQNVRSIDDLSGTIKAKLSQTQAMSLPGLDRVVPFLSGGISTSTVFDQGRLVGSFSHGVLRVRQFSLSSSSLKVFADGTITRTLRLNLNVTARTGQQGGGGLLSTAFLAELPLFGPTPIGLIIEANRLLANQVVNLVVRGTLSNPSISIRPIPLLAEEAVRFFLLQVPGGAALGP